MRSASIYAPAHGLHVATVWKSTDETPCSPPRHQRPGRSGRGGDYTSGHDHHHEDLAFYPAGYYNPGFYSPLSTKPSCLVRITRDAGQNATGLIIDEFNWYFPRTEIGRLRVNTEFIRS